MGKKRTIKRLSYIISLLFIIVNMTACGASGTSKQTESSEEPVINTENTAELTVGGQYQTIQEESMELPQEEQIAYRLVKEIYTERLYTTETEYDEQGNAVKETMYVEGTELHVTEREFDADSKLLKELSTYLLEGNTSVTVWEYDEQGNKTAVYEENESGENSLKTAWEYDDAGNMIKEIEYQEQKAIETKEYSYDAAGNQVKACFYDENNSLTDEILWEYDTNGNRISEKDYWNGSLYSHMEWEYDEKGNMLTAITYYDDGSQYIVSMKYDEAGNRIEMNTDYEGDGNIDDQIRNEITYDEAGNIVKDVCYNSQNEIEYTIEWEYIQIQK